MSNREVNPIINGLGEDFELELCDYKRPWVYGEVSFICPDCGNIQAQNLQNGDPLEYGRFFGYGECFCCGVKFKDQQFKVTATVKIEAVQ